MSSFRGKSWGLDAAEFQEGMELLGHLCMWKEQDQNSLRGLQLLVLLISCSSPGSSVEPPLRHF